MCEKCPNSIQCSLLRTRTPLPMLIEHKLYKHCFDFQKSKNDGAYIGRVWGSRVLKKILPALYPQYKWSVKSASFAGGNSIDCSFLDEQYEGRDENYSEEKRAEDKAIDAICVQFEDGHFNGMNDSYEYDDRLMGCSKYISARRKTVRDWQYV